MHTGPDVASTSQSYHRLLSSQADRLFLLLGTVMAAASLAIAVWNQSWLPLLAISLPSWLLMAVQVRLNPGSLLTRNTVALVLMALVAAMIQQTHGLVEMHFGVFVVLALLLYYRDWVPVVVAASAISVHHLGFWWLQSQGLPIRAFAIGSGLEVVLLHAAYVVVETLFVSRMAVNLRREADLLGENPGQLHRFVGDIAAGNDTGYSQQWQAAPGSLADRLVAMQHDLQARNAREQVLNKAAPSDQRHQAWRPAADRTPAERAHRAPALPGISCHAPPRSSRNTPCPAPAIPSPTPSLLTRQFRHGRAGCTGC